MSQRVDYKTSREKSVPKPSMGIDGDKDVLWAKIIKNKYTWEWRFFFEWGGGWAGGGLGVGWGWRREVFQSAGYICEKKKFSIEKCR